MKYINKDVIICDYSWIGMGEIILLGVILGKRTIVAAGSVVTKSFPDGFCVIGGNPAKFIKVLEREKFVPTCFKEEYYGFIPKKDFKTFAKKYLKNNKFIKDII